MQLSALMILILLCGKFVDGSPKKNKANSRKHSKPTPPAKTISTTQSSTIKSIERIKIKKSPKDHRTYRGLKLENDLKVLLIHDPSAKKSAASLAIGVGGLYDFPEVPGLANLLAFLMIRGSVKYPIDYDFNRYIETNGGHTEFPVTKAQSQIFSFDVRSNRFDHALDRFADLFLQPLFHETSPIILERTINFVKMERERREKLDGYRVTEVEKLLCKKGHLYCHFFLGTEETFFQHTNDVPELSEKKQKLASLFGKVKSFHSRYYSSNLMTLAVLGRDCLDDLEKIVVRLFGGLENKDQKKMIFSYSQGHHPWQSEQLKHKIYIVPRKDVHLLRLNFPIPDYTNEYKVSPDVYLSNLLKKRIPGSLYTVLIDMDWANKLEVNWKYMDGISFFSINVELTDDGVEMVVEIIDMIFQYLHLVEENGVREEIFRNEKKSLEEIFNDGKFILSKDPLVNIEQLAESMQLYPLEDILSFNYIRDEWKPSLVKDLLSYLRPDNMNISIVSKSVQKFADQKEPFYGIEYGIQEIPPKFIEKWSEKRSILGLYIPESNKDVADILYSTDKHEPKYPYIIHKSSKAEIWFKKDDLFKVPRICIMLDLYSPVSRYSPGERVSFYIFYDVLTSLLENNLDYSVLSGLNWDVSLGSAFIRIMLEGHSSKMLVFLEEFLSTLIDVKEYFSLNEGYLRDRLMEYLENTSVPYRKSHLFQVNWYLHHLLSETGYAVDSDIAAAKRMLQSSDVRKFVPKIFKRIFIRSFIHGNCLKSMAKDMVNIIEQTFQSSTGLLLQEILRPRVVEIAEGSHFVKQVFNEKFNRYGYTTHFLFVTKPNDVQNNVAMYLFHQAVHETCHKIMSAETEKELDQIQCAILVMNGTPGFTIATVTGLDNHTMAKRVEYFLRDVPDILGSLSTAELKRIKTIVENSDLKPPANLHQLTEQYWFEISNRFYIFNRSEIELKTLHSMKRADLLDYFRKMFDNVVPRRRRLTVHILPEDVQTTKPSLINKISAGADKIGDMDDFKSSSNLLPYNFNPNPSADKF